MNASTVIIITLVALIAFELSTGTLNDLYLTAIAKAKSSPTCEHIEPVKDDLTDDDIDCEEDDGSNGGESDDYEDDEFCVMTMDEDEHEGNLDDEQDGEGDDQDDDEGDDQNDDEGDDQGDGDGGADGNERL
jgi:hypothetical protein